MGREVAHERRVVALHANERAQKEDYIQVLATAERLLDTVNGAVLPSDTERRQLRVLLGGTVRRAANPASTTGRVCFSRCRPTMRRVGRPGRPPSV